MSVLTLQGSRTSSLKSWTAGRGMTWVASWGDARVPHPFTWLASLHDIDSNDIVPQPPWQHIEYLEDRLARYVLLQPWPEQQIYRVGEHVADSRGRRLGTVVEIADSSPYGFGTCSVLVRSR